MIAAVPVGIAHELADEGPGWPAPPPVIHDERPRLTERLDGALRAIPPSCPISVWRVGHRLQCDTWSARARLVALAGLDLVEQTEAGWQLTPKGRQML